MNGCCCVEASTLVLMADGSQRPIRDLRIVKPGIMQHAA